MLLLWGGRSLLNVNRFSLWQYLVFSLGRYQQKRTCWRHARGGRQTQSRNASVLTSNYKTGKWADTHSVGQWVIYSVSHSFCLDIHPLLLVKCSITHMLTYTWTRACTHMHIQLQNYSHITHTNTLSPTRPFTLHWTTILLCPNLALCVCIDCIIVIAQCCCLSLSAAVCHLVLLSVAQCCCLSLSAAVCCTVLLSVAQCCCLSLSAAVCHSMLLSVAQCCCLSLSAAVCHSVLLSVAQCCCLSLSAAVCRTVLLSVAQCCCLSLSAAVCCTVLLSVAQCCCLSHSAAICCSVLLFIAQCCCLSHSAAVCRSVLLSVAQCCCLSHSAAVCRSMLLSVAQCCYLLLSAALHCSVLLSVAQCCYTDNKTHLLRCCCLVHCSCLLPGRWLLWHYRRSRRKTFDCGWMQWMGRNQWVLNSSWQVHFNISPQCLALVSLGIPQ